MPSDKIQHLAVAIKGLERKITEASNEIDRKYPHVRGTCCQSCYYGSGGYTEAEAKQDRRMEWLRELKQKMVKATGYEPESKMKCAKCGGNMGLEFVSDNPTMGIAYNVYSCDDCLSYVEAYHWASANGVRQMSEHKLLALAYVWRAECGYEVPTPLAYRGSLAELGAVTNALHRLTQTGHIKRIGNRYLMRDACPSCFRRGGCTEQCMLHMGVSFAPLRKPG